MDKDAALEAIGRFRKSLEKQGIVVNKIVLFGSFASGRYHEYSDIDLVVISDDFKNKGFWDRIEILSNAIYEVWQPIEATALTPEEWEKGDLRIVDYAKDGEVVYGA
jgi:predicted nucleotidyltransferase